jgi:lipopolysaccharide transport system ATP-binding protein
MVEPLMALDKVGIRYRKRKSFFRHDYYQALESVSFTLQQGDALGIIGRNGCGKSTLLRLLAGIYRPDSGEIKRRLGLRVSLLSLQAGFDPELSGLDNALLSATLLGMRYSEAKARLDEIIEFAELQQFALEPVKTYSTGMRARLGFSVAMKMSPDVLLIDETLGVGDARFREKAEKSLEESFGGRHAVVLVSHSAVQVKRLCNRALWIDQGVVKVDGKVDEVLECYSRAS